MTLANAHTAEGYEGFADLRPQLSQPSGNTEASETHPRLIVVYQTGSSLVSSLREDDDHIHSLGIEWAREKFLCLLDQWRAERIGAVSSIAEIVACPSHLKIIAMGSIALPFIMEQLVLEEEDPDHWGAALEAITGDNPVPEDAYGDTVGIARTWLRWDENRDKTKWNIPASTRYFPTSATEIVESQVREHDGTIVSHGQPNLLLSGGGRVEV